MNRRLAIILGVLIAGGATVTFVATQHNASQRATRIFDRRCRGGCTGAADTALLRILPAGGPPYQIANPAGVTTKSGGVIADSRSTANFAQKNLTFDASNFGQGWEQIGSSTAGWALVGSGVVVPLLTLNADIAPDGTTSASSLAFPSTTGIQFSAARVLASGLSGTNVFSVYLRVTSGTGTVLINFGSSPTAGTPLACSLTTSWQRFSFTFTGTNPGGYIETTGTAAAVTVSAWGEKIEAGSTPMAYASPMLVTIPATTPRAEPAGVLSEGAATNLILQSEAFNSASWTKTSVVIAAPTVTADAAIAPDSNKTADTLTFPAVTAGNASYATQGFTATAALYSDSVWLRSLSGAGTKTIYLYFTDSATVPTQYLGTTACSVTEGQWTRCTTTATLTAATWFLNLGVDTRDGSQSAQSAFSVYAWEAQAELGGFSSSDITTTTVAVARSADAISTTTLAVGTTPSYAATATLKALPVGGNAFVSSWVNSSTDRWNFYVLPSGKLRCEYVNGSTFDADSTATITAGTATRVSCNYNGTNMKACVGGSCASTALTFTGSASYTTNGIGYDANAGGSQLNGWLRDVCIATTAGGCS